MPIIVKKCAIWREHATIIALMRQTNVCEMENNRNIWKSLDKKREKCLNKPENSEKKPKYSLKMEKDKKITNLARRLLYIET